MSRLIGASTSNSSVARFGLLASNSSLVSVAKCVDLPDDGSVMPMNWA